MISLILEIPEYSWTLSFHFAVTCYHAETIMDELRGLGCPRHILARAHKLMGSCQMDTGLTYSDPQKRTSVVVVGLTTDGAEFINSLEHEIRHAVDDITLADSYFDKEGIAYLTGEINRALYPHIHKLLCDECRDHLPVEP